MNHLRTFNSDLLSRQVDDYRIDETVLPDYLFKGTFKPLGLVCAVRVNKLAESELELLENEVQLDRLTSHPNLLKMFTHFLGAERSWWCIFPLSPYPAMDRLCKPYGLPEPVICFVLSDILQAVDYLHRNNIIHRAIKGSHILMFGNLQSSVKFVLSGLKSSHYLSKFGNSQTFDYPKNAPKILKCLAHEVLEQDLLGYNFKTDIYAIGILCCEMANGVMPFDNMATDQILFYKIIGDTPGLLDSTCPEMKAIQDYLNQMESSLNRRYEEYSQRKYSTSFHHFVVKACLASENTRRATVRELLEHAYMQANLKRHGHDKMRLLGEHLGQSG